MERAQKATTILAAAWGAVLLGLCVHLGISTEVYWAAPVILIFYFLAYEFDVKVPGLGSINVDQAIAFPAVMLFESPALAGVLAGLGMAASRLYRRGPRGFRPVNAFDSVQTAVSVTLGGWYFLSSTRDLSAESGLWYLDLVLAMTLSSAVNWSAVLMGQFFTRRRAPLSTVRRSIFQTVLWIVLSSPFVALVVGAIADRRPLHILLAGIPLLIVVWTLKLNARLEERNEELLMAGRKQEFLQALTARPETSLENEVFLKDLLAGLNSFVSWDKAALLVLPVVRGSEPLLVTLGDGPRDPALVKERLMSLLEEAALKKARLSQGEAVEPLLLDRAGSQVMVAVATPEVAFGALIAETGPGRPGLKEEEALFLELALSEVAHLTQEGVLRSHLLTTNEKLVQQMNYLKQILQISDLLKVHLDVQGILDRVAVGIRESLGFQNVLISLYHEEEGFFERIAQAGMDDRWEEIQRVRPPAQEILSLLEEKYRLGNCYFISHTEAVPSPYDVLPVNPKAPKTPDDWDPMDMLLVTLVDKDRRLLGVIFVDEPQDGKIPSEEALKALEILANQTVHALESAQIHAQIKRQATLDGLTGLYNHAHFQKTLAARTKELIDAKAAYTVLMMDMDNFKDINDTFGHLAGDAVLRAVAHALASSIRRDDVAARYGGEEFAVLLPHLGLSQAKNIAERIRKTVEEIRLLAEGGGGPIRVTLSVGMASCPENGTDHQHVLEQADAALYEAKRAGKNRVWSIARGTK